MLAQTLDLAEFTESDSLADILQQFAEWVTVDLVPKLTDTAPVLVVSKILHEQLVWETLSLSPAFQTKPKQL